MTKKKMKKLLLTTALVLGLASCETETQIKDYKTKDKIPFSVITHFEYKGHDYIFFDTAENQCSVGGVVHDPDCKCKANKEE